MSFRLYNTLTRSVEDFAPADGKTVRMYTCGPTVYNPAHIGNFRTFLFEDLLRRALRLHGWDVVQVMNLTDVDDKIIKRAQERGLTITQVTEPIELLVGHAALELVHRRHALGLSPSSSVPPRPGRPSCELVREDVSVARII